MTKGLIIGGEFGNILVRQKSGCSLELGELMVADTSNGRMLLQVFDLLYGSQLTQGSLELVSGLKLEEDDSLELMDAKLRTYVLARLKNLAFLSGVKATSAKTLPTFFTKIKEIAAAGLGLVLSGSPRTVGEAQNLLPVLEKLYGRKNMLFFVLKVPPETSLKRNSRRLICSVCGSPLLRVRSTENFTVYSPCPFCGGKLVKRTLDRLSVIKDRLIEFDLKTLPVFAAIKKNGYKVNIIKGDALPFKVFDSIKKEIIKI